MSIPSIRPKTLCLTNRASDGSPSRLFNARSRLLAYCGRASLRGVWTLSFACLSAVLVVQLCSSQVSSGPLLNVKAGGAQGTGAVDDSAPIQRAINSASGRAVLVPSGKYRLDRGLVIRDPNVTLRLDDGAVLIKNCNCALITVRAPNVAIEGGTLDGQRALGFTGPGINLGTGTGTLTTQVSVKGAKIISQGGEGISMRNVEDFTIEGNHLSENAKGGIFGEFNVRGGVIKNNDIENLTAPANNHAIGFHSTRPNNQIREVVISENRLTNDSTFCIEVGAFGGQRPDQITVGPQNICRIKGTGFGAISLDSVDHAKVFDNTIECLATKSHLGVEVVMSREITVSNNIIEGKDTLMTGVALTGSSRCVVQKNVITGVAVRGIGLYSGSDRPNSDDDLIEGNRVTLAPVPGEVFGVQIRVNHAIASASRTSIRGNQITGTGRGGFGVSVERISGALDDTEVSSNTFENLDVGIDERHSKVGRDSSNLFHSVAKNSTSK